MKLPIRLGRAFATVGLWTMASRILGFVRDVLIAAFLGTGPAHQAFVIAFSLPNLFRRFFAEGAFNMAFVPMFSKKLESGEDPAGFARDAFSALGGLLIVFTILSQLAMPWLVLAMASGFADQQFDLAVFFGRITFPYILFISLAALLSGVLNATGRFAAAAAAPVLLNILFIGAIALAAALGRDVALWLAWVVPVAGVAQMALVWVAAKRAGFCILPRVPRMTPELRRLALIAAPAVLANGVIQINLLVGRQVASYFDRAVSWLYNADRLYQLPLGVVAIAIGVVLLPDLSRKLKAEDPEGGRSSYNRAMEFALALTIPAAVALMVIPLPLVSVLFERGAFTRADSVATAMAVAVYGVGLPAFVIQKVVQPLYYAREDTRRPFRFAVFAMVVNAVVAIGFAPQIGYISAAVAATVAGWVMVLMLVLGTRNMGHEATFDPRLRARAPRIVFASLIMGAALFGVQWLLLPYFEPGPVRYLALTALIAVGVAVYFIAGAMLGAFHKDDFRQALRR